MDILKKSSGEVRVIGQSETNENVSFDLNMKMSGDFMWEYVNKVSEQKVDAFGECDHKVWADCLCGM